MHFRYNHMYSLGMIFGLLFCIAGCTKRPLVHTDTISAKEKYQLRVMTVNIGHGRGGSAHQLLVGTKKNSTNLQRIASILREYDVDLAALQEIDAPSFWSARIDQTKVLAKQSELSYSFHGSHVRMMNLNYGTAILSKHKTVDSFSTTFQPHPPLPNKGFVVSQVHTEFYPSPIIVVSLHLDFARTDVRREQLQEVSRAIETLPPSPLIVMGDYNMEWSEILADFCKKHALQAFSPYLGQATFPRTQKRLEWILISEPFHFTAYHVLPDILSDHNAILATIEVKD